MRAITSLVVLFVMTILLLGASTVIETPLGRGVLKTLH